VHFSCVFFLKKRREFSDENCVFTNYEVL
jgi:hypothetical protein